ncbi:pyrroline-5-carboxylate reductase [Oceanospirillum maris]|uniref:pyrroline-5-carboxylate reductase n=1 Tax=Oceanospirillum maris TaxID=64977 RepID=UPI000403643F|nr:pyrroline-5-carboxylate reductase [Oceanospirillum maris]
MSEVSSGNILVIGAGRMGGAIINGWLQQGIGDKTIYIVDPNAEGLKSFTAHQGVYAVADVSGIPADIQFDYALLATKPQVIEQTLPTYKHLFNASTLLISVAAGTTSETLARLAEQPISIIRIMPNTPALIGRGVMVASPNAQVSDKQKQACEALFTPLGNFYWVDDEEQMHAVTAVSGSGPAYLFYFAEAMVAGAISTGLPKELAIQLALDTVTGASALLEQDNRAPAELRKEVTSPKGTTEAALNIMMNDDALPELMKKAMAAAAVRSEELAQGK